MSSAVGTVVCADDVRAPWGQTKIMNMLVSLSLCLCVSLSLCPYSRSLVQASVSILFAGVAQFGRAPLPHIYNISTTYLQHIKPNNKIEKQDDII